MKNNLGILAFYKARLFNYTDEANKLGGSFEVVEIDGEEYLINFWFAGLDSSEIDKTYGYMMEFNELNGFEPVEV